VVSRRISEKESLHVSWFELIRVFRQLEARGETRGGYFVGGLSGEQFARPEAIGLLRSIRKAKAKGEFIAISAADPLNLIGILTPGPRIPAVTSHRILLRDGVPIAALRAGQVIELERQRMEAGRSIQNALLVGTLPPKLRPYYA
jgi:ATP-dependent Lhr-like helicase